ncbi:GIY-YIG nuclease family protein [Azorhizobium doebereinerae]|uniref:GIY-YIG nuclease family protein n=1 Tax=Azorhizobium doebereinerae TaxID=281091 RepID=UPI00048FDBE0|nr:GIY-YIG nuclease family protein [Azorhizobium doebereinerae]
MNREDRKAAIAAYRERKVPAGIYAVRCAAVPTPWIGAAPNLDMIRNRIWFTLRHGSHTNPAMQAAWLSHGAESFRLEILEVLPEEDVAYVRGRLLKERLTHWRAVLDAPAA